MIAIGRVLPNPHFPRARAEEIELYRNLARLPIRKRAEEPLVAGTAYHHQVLRYRSVRHARVIPDGGHELQEIRARLIAKVIGMIAHAANRAVIDDE